MTSKIDGIAIGIDPAIFSKYSKVRSGIDKLFKPNSAVVRFIVGFGSPGIMHWSITPSKIIGNGSTTNSKEVNALPEASSEIILQSVLESFSKGAEHGHVHIHTNDKSFPSLLFISLCIHAFSEGLPIHNAGDNLLWAIVVHKIPIAIVLTTFLLHIKYAKKIVFTFLLFFGLMSPLGMLIGDKILFFNTYASEITALIIGVFLHISTIILFESSDNHKFNIQKFTAILIGILLTIFTL